MSAGSGIGRAWTRWMRQPKTMWVRKALFQVHLWSGLALGLYIVVLCVTGSALVFRAEMTQAFETPLPPFEEGRKGLSSEELTAAAQKLYPGYEITRVGNRFTRRRPAIEIWAQRGDEIRMQLFNPYTGEELGEALPLGVRVVIRTADLHNDLMLGDLGQRINGIASGLVAVVAVTGLVIWWPGVQAWRRALWVRWNVRWPRFNFDLHSALGFWFFGIIFLWAVSGLYMAIPGPFHAVIDAFSDPEAILGERPADVFLQWVVRLHFGRWRDMPWLSALWVVMGLVPVIMFVTGTIMWWNRVIKKR